MRSVNEKEICGQQECFPADSVQLVQRTEPEAAKVVVAVLVVAALVALFAAGLRSIGPVGFPAGTAFH